MKTLLNKCYTTFFNIYVSAYFRWETIFVIQVYKWNRLLRIWNTDKGSMKQSLNIKQLKQWKWKSHVVCLDFKYQVSFF